MYCNAFDTAKGRQMCNHFQHKGSNYPSWSSVIGTQIMHGVGAAFAAKKLGKDEVHAIYFGDGATSSNGFHSGMTFAGVWKAPAVFVCIHNGWAISVPSSAQTAAKRWTDKGIAYGIPAAEVDGNDVLACYGAMENALERARSGEGPTLLIVNTYRMMGHSSSDDPSVYRDAAEVDPWKDRDPITRYAKFLEGRGILESGEAETIERELTEETDAEIHKQEAAPGMPLRSLVEDVYAEVPKHLMAQYNNFIETVERHGEAQKGDGAFPL
jgi:2-oxoisovalerate dehydrogenase E1 component alpha subunit